MFRKAIALILVLVLLLPLGAALATQYYRVNTSSLKAHERPKYSSTVVASYRRDSAVTIAKVGVDGWVKIRFRPGGPGVFVQKKYLKACSSYTAYVSKNDTALLSGPATSYKSLGKLDRGAKVTVLGKGYVRNSRLTASSKKPSRSTAYIKNYEGKRVCLRKGPGTKYKTIATYKSGTRVTVLKYGKKWCKVRVGGRTGYMKTIFIKWAK